MFQTVTPNLSPNEGRRDLVKFGSGSFQFGTFAERTLGITLIPGLYNNLKSDTEWGPRFKKWLDANSVYDASYYEYRETLFTSQKQHETHIDGLATLLDKELLEHPYGKQHVIAHSNGCRLILECLNKYRRFVLDDLHLLAAWAPRDARKHINRILADRQVRRIILYTSTADCVLAMNALWPPYADFTLGRLGPTNLNWILEKNPLSQRSPSYLQQVERNKFGHSDHIQHASVWECYERSRSADAEGFQIEPLIVA